MTSSTHLVISSLTLTQQYCWNKIIQKELERKP
jgi:hypothetical protein